MGSREVWQAHNIALTRKAAEEIVWQNRAAHLREQGILGPADGAAEARAHDAAQKRAAAKTRQAEADAGANPKGVFLFGLGWIALWVLVHLISRAAGSPGWITFTGWAIALAVVITFVTTVVQSQARTRDLNRS